MSTKRKSLYYFRGVTENKELAKAIEKFFNENNPDDDMVKSFFLEEATKFAKLYNEACIKLEVEIDKNIKLLEDNCEIKMKINSFNEKAMQFLNLFTK